MGASWGPCCSGMESGHLGGHFLPRWAAGQTAQRRTLQSWRWQVCGYMLCMCMLHTLPAWPFCIFVTSVWFDSGAGASLNTVPCGANSERRVAHIAGPLQVCLHRCFVIKLGSSCCGCLQMRFLASLYSSQVPSSGPCTPPFSPL